MGSCWPGIRPAPVQCFLGVSGTPRPWIVIEAASTGSIRDSHMTSTPALTTSRGITPLTTKQSKHSLVYQSLRWRHTNNPHAVTTSSYDTCSAMPMAINTTQHNMTYHEMILHEEAATWSLQRGSVNSNHMPRCYSGHHNPAGSFCNNIP